MNLNSKSNKILAVTLGWAIALTGCQKAGQTSSSSLDQSSSLGVACQPQTNVDPASLKIVGAASTQAGSLVNYKLNVDLSCTPNQKVAWKEVLPGASYQDGNTLTTSYSKAGVYVVSAQVQSATSADPVTISAKTVVSSAVTLNGPQYAMASIPASFSLAVPTGVTVASASWDFGDATAVQSGAGPLSHIYLKPGAYTVSVAVVDSTGASATLTQVITVIQALDGFECVTQLAISGPTAVNVGDPVAMTAFLPTCVGSRVSGLVWNFGDVTPTSGNQSVTHTYTTAGTYHVTVAVSVVGATSNPMFILTHDIVVSDVTQPAPAPTPTPTPAPAPNPLSCLTAGQTRVSQGEIYTREVACGVNGKRSDSYRDQITETCKLTASGEQLLWTETSRVPQLQSEGQCQGQACALPAEAMTGVTATAQGVSVIGGQYYLLDGASLSFYSSQAPAASCTTVQQARSCANGVLSGTTDYKYLLCVNGCSGFGPDGTVKTGVVTGEISVAKTCQFGETGFNDLFNQIADQKCSNGQVSTYGVRQGSLKTAAVCPVYSWVPTETYTACSAACGGTQSRVYVCRDGAGNVAPTERCVTAAPVDTLVCDGNPDSVKRSDSVTSTDEGGSTQSCPAHQIGVIVKSREMTVTTNYACLNHSVQQVSQTTTYGDWVEDNYCREYVGFRCSQDSLDNNHAHGRYDWMVKCAGEVPVIKEFLDKFDDVTAEKDKYGKSIKGGFGLGDKGRVLYPTFMDREGKNKNGEKCEKPWIAPTSVDAPCKVPSTVYVAAVCVSSCATPEQMIMAQAEAHAKLKYVTVEQAWQDKFAFVATLQSHSAMNAKQVTKTKVEQWVTELVDTHHVILEFHMKSGGQLRLTPNHPLLGSDAIMRTAGDFKVGDQLVQLGGVSDEIVSIVTQDYFGKVYNVFVKSADLQKNIVVTNGYLNGTAMYQNEGAKYLNKKIFRAHMIEGAFKK